uniref:Cysteine-rich transmembrane CYSTM domain-containing protein n=1 Tax=Lactuca sativa TaxID=4236 RepID=A0A9R1W3E0_LACSA|nr:hypothetical protein LSAT_V11C300136740 [Lactuca sativa]
MSLWWCVLSLLFNCYDTEYDVLRPRTFPPFRFGAVTACEADQSAEGPENGPDRLKARCGGPDMLKVLYSCCCCCCCNIYDYVLMVFGGNSLSIRLTVLGYVSDENVPSAKWASHLRKYKCLKHNCASGSYTFADEMPISQMGPSHLRNG